MKKSIIEDNREKKCFICGYQGYLERHHVFGGPDRTMSEKYGLTVHLCIRCHRGKEGVHNDAEIMQLLHEIGQKAFEKTHSREEFMCHFRKNYLEKEKEPVQEPEGGFIFLGDV